MIDQLLVVDGTNLVHRLFHAVTDRPAAEAFGFALGRLRKQHAPSHAVVVFDPIDDYPSWRRSIWPGYKANRPARPEGLGRTRVEARQQCRNARIAVAVADDVEADDVIAAYVNASVREGMGATIVSGDKDLVQLVRDEPVPVRMLDQVRKKTWGPVEAREHFGVEPERLPDLLALIGDQSDGYAGVQGIGAKTAGQLLLEYGTLDNLLERKNLVRSTRVMKLLQAQESSARICYQLAKLRDDIALPVPLAGCKERRS